MEQLVALRRRLYVSVLLVALILSFGSVAAGQAAQSTPPNPLGAEITKKYPGLLPELGRLTDRLQHNVTFPPDRVDSRLLPLLPSSTIAYLGLPNYGGVARQALTIFQQELNASPDLRAWWEDSGMAKANPQIDDAIDKFSTVCEFLGDEIVVSGVLEGREPDLLIISEVHKPGLKAVLQNFVIASSTSKPNIRILDPQELATAPPAKPQELLILVRLDFVIASNSLDRLRSFNSSLDHGNRDFASSPFAQRILRSYVGGVSWVGALNLQRLVAQIPKDPGFAKFQQTGFADVKYAIWEHRQAGGHSISQSELSFTGPRQGIAAWLVAPQPIGGLEFVSPKTIFALALVLENPALIFDDIRQLSASNPNAFASIPQMEQSLGISLQQDVLAQLTGELTLELDSLTPQPAWRVVLGVKDPDRLQQTFANILTRTRVPANEYSQAGVVYHVLSFPSAQGTNVIAYAFVDRYLLLASSLDALSEAVRLHRSGDSLGRSPRFLGSLPSRSAAVSALLYEDPAAMMALQMQRLSPEQAQTMTQLMGKSTPVVMSVYGEPDAIREASSSPGVDAGVVLVGAAIAIPNLLRARMAANEASAVGKLRVVNTAQVTYKYEYPNRGFAPDLAALGTDASNTRKSSPAHAGLIDNPLGSVTCTEANWCDSSGYRFILKGSCNAGQCRDFVAVATPLSTSTGTRTFCSTADGVIRYRIAPPLSFPPALAECKQWKPIQ